MNELGQLEERLRQALPSVRLTLTEPAAADGVWWLDIEYEGRRVVVEWQAGRAFGITSEAFADTPFGVGPEEMAQGIDEASDRIMGILTRSVRPVPLAEVRKNRGFSQQELARRLDLDQASVSKLERRHDMLISTLQEFGSAMEAELEQAFRFRDGSRHPIVLGEGAAARVSSAQPLVRRRVAAGHDDEIRGFETVARAAARHDPERFLVLLPAYTQRLVESLLENTTAGRSQAVAWADTVAQAFRHAKEAQAPNEAVAALEDTVSKLLTRYSSLRAGNLLAEVFRSLRPAEMRARAKPRVAVLVPGFSTDRFIKSLLSRVVLKAGYTDWLLNAITHDSARHINEMEVLSRLGSDVSDIDAAIVFSFPHIDVDELRRLVTSFGKPVVFVDNYPFDKGVLPGNAWFVGSDNAQGASEVAEFVKTRADILQRKLKVLVICDTRLQMERQEEFKKRLDPDAADLVEELRVTTFNAHDVGNRIADYVRNPHPVPDLIFATSDDLGHAAVAAIVDREYWEQVSIISWDGMHDVVRDLPHGYSRFIASVQQNRERLVDKVVEVVDRALRGDIPSSPDGRKFLVETKLEKARQESSEGAA